MLSHYQSSLGLGLLLCSTLLHAETFSAKVIAILDGDTLLIKRGAQAEKIRLAEIDAPEKDQPSGEQAKQALSQLVLNKTVQIDTQTIDQYGRIIAQVSQRNQSINRTLIQQGWAWEYSNFHSNKQLIALQQQAQKNKLGLWNQNNPTPPWEWRKSHQTASTNCEQKRYCSQMTSCDEAKYFLQHCGIQSLDGNHDGVPCESLCKPAKK